MTRRLSLENSDPSRPGRSGSGGARWSWSRFLTGLMLVQAWSFAGEPAGGLPTPRLTNIADIRALKPWEIARSLPVRLEGIVTFSQVEWQLLFVQDASGGCYILPTGIRRDLAQGSWVRVEGTITKGRNFPFIESPQIEPLPEPPEDRPHPHPRFMGLTELAAGRDDSQWGETEGVVRAVKGGDSNWVLELGNAAAQVEVQISSTNRVPPPYRWLNAQLRVRGVCTVIHKNARPISLLHTARLADLSVVRESPEPLFQEPFLDLRALPRRLADATNFHRVRLRGQVWHVSNAMDMYMGEAPHGIRLRGTGLAGLTLGDEAEAAGFLTWADGQWELANAEARRKQTAPLPKPVVLTAREPVPPPDHMKLINLEGRIAGWKFSPSTLSLNLFRTRTGESLSVVISEPYQSVLQQLQLGSVVQVSGLWQPRRFQDRTNVLLCRTAADFQVLHPPAWWTPRRVASALAVAGVSGLLMVGWIVTLRHRVARQTQQIREQFASQTQLEQRFRELFENANDAVLVLDDRLRIIELNSAAIRILGASPDRLLGQSFPEYFTEADAARFMAQLGNETPATLPISLTFRHHEATGQVRTLEITSCQRWVNSSRHEIQVIAHDISDRIRAETETARWHQEFARLSRHAGVADAAKHVLHNVGNVLNSVSVSASLMLEQLRTSNSLFLAKAAKLLNAHRENAGEFLKNDPTGKKLPAFFEAAADELIREQTLLSHETQNLRQNIEHIQQIVSQQQPHAPSGGLEEILTLHDVVEDALRLVSRSLERQQIEIVRQFEAVPPVLADRHKVINILVNLIDHARQALAERTAGRRLNLRIARGHPDRVRVEITDNGAGISPENLVRIFKYDITNKNAGLGGLHSGANAAKEMGGSLSVLSDGPGTGSTFILELPDCDR